MTPPIESLDIHANGLRFAVRAAGEGPLVLCLHGFPDSAHTFDDLLPRLAAEGYRAVAPFMRGYAPTAAPRDGDCRVPTLARDVLGLADALGSQRFSLVGHDWGSVIALTTAAMAPVRVERVVAAAVPPLRWFLANMRPAQILRSWYIGYFQLPGWPETHLGLSDGRFIEWIWRRWAPEWDFTEADIAPVRAALATRTARRAVLGYYRGLPGALLSLRRASRRGWLIAPPRQSTLCIYGERDGCIGPEMWRGVTGSDCRVAGLAAGHFMHREQPEAFAGMVTDFLSEGGMNAALRPGRQSDAQPPA